MLGSAQRKILFDAAKRRGAIFRTQADVRDFDQAIDTAYGPQTPPQPAPTPLRPVTTTSGLPDDYWPMLARIESGNRPYVKASTSTASGLYQFIKSTWLGEGGRWGSNPRLAFGGLRPSVEEQLQRAKSFTAKNAAFLRKRGIPINRATLYAAHFLGAGTAAKLLGAASSASAEALAGKGPTNANPSVLRNKTVAEFLAWLHRKTGMWAR